MDSDFDSAMKHLRAIHTVIHPNELPYVKLLRCKEIIEHLLENGLQSNIPNAVKRWAETEKLRLEKEKNRLYMYNKIETPRLGAVRRHVSFSYSPLNETEETICIIPHLGNWARPAAGQCNIDERCVRQDSPSEWVKQTQLYVGVTMFKKVPDSQQKTTFHETVVMHPNFLENVQRAFIETVKNEIISKAALMAACCVGNKLTTFISGTGKILCSGKELIVIENTQKPQWPMPLMIHVDEHSTDNLDFIVMGTASLWEVMTVQEVRSFVIQAKDEIDVAARLSSDEVSELHDVLPECIVYRRNEKEKLSNWESDSSKSTCISDHEPVTVHDIFTHPQPVAEALIAEVGKRGGFSFCTSIVVLFFNPFS